MVPELPQVPALDGVPFPPVATHAFLPGADAFALAQSTPAAPRGEGWQETFPAVLPVPGYPTQSRVPGFGRGRSALPISVLLSEQALPRL